MKRLFILALSIIPYVCSSQNWERIYTKTAITEVSGFLPTSDGGYLIAGNRMSGKINQDGFLMKIDQNGNKVWFRVYGGKGFERVNGITACKDGYIMVGANKNTGVAYERSYVVKTDFNGNTIKTTYIDNGIYGDERAWGIVRISDERFIIHASSPAEGKHYQANLVLIDNDLNVLINKQHGGEGVEYIYKLISTSDGGYATVGTTSSYGVHDNGDIYFLKLDKNLDEDWHRVYPGRETDVAFGIIQHSTGYYVSARSDSYGRGSNDLYFLCTDNSGEVLWTKTYGTTNEEYYGYLFQTSDGELFLTSTVDAPSTALPGHMWLLGIEKNAGAILSDQRFGEQNELGRIIIEGPNRSLLIAGTSQKGNSQKYVYVVKVSR